jgi:hypothetical protein
MGRAGPIAIFTIAHPAQKNALRPIYFGWITSNHLHHNLVNVE